MPIRLIALTLIKSKTAAHADPRQLSLIAYSRYDMLGLGAYESDDGEDNASNDRNTDVTQQRALPTNQNATSTVSNPKEGRSGPEPNGFSSKHRDPNPVVHITQEDDKDGLPIGADIGPMVGPSVPSPASSETTSSRPTSPFSLSRSLIRDLTLPPVPDLNIPPSPPGSPPPSTTAKFAHFLELKKQGIHFNEKLARSSALKNPSLLQKLMGFAGIEGQAQYISTLPKETWDPEAFPIWGYKEELAKSQQEITKRLEDERAKEIREAIDFVPATASGESSRGGTPGVSSSMKSLGRSAAERVMAGLDREKTRSPLVPDGGKRREMERRGRGIDEKGQDQGRDQETEDGERVSGTMIEDDSVMKDLVCFSSFVHLQSHMKLAASTREAKISI
ncbi:hypothetical protein FGG08_002168 [Glutinoglossum americanum]|uniref:Uncharacterized protein n=1 Tax=Glutinoglossum americanum TaxID=1670608 RepID=A0A9P8IDC0_9PEZI|nr:hypothetical protein FGG08_002168 [Glutinoglossum americanum]